MDCILHPAYFPNLRTLRCLLSERVCWEVWDNFQKQTYRNRCHIATDRGLHRLTIPIRHEGGTKGRQRYREVRIDNSYPWKRTHWRSLETAYRAAPFFEFYESEVQALFGKPFEFLMDWNLATTNLLCRLIGIDFPEVHTEGYSEYPEGMADLRPLVDAKSGEAEDLPPYMQVFQERTGFIPNLSGLDLVFNEGNQSRAYLEGIPIPEPPKKR